MLISHPASRTAKGNPADAVEPDSPAGDTSHPGAPRRSSVLVSDTPRLDAVSRDLTREAADGLLEPLIGRSREIEQIVEILCRRSKGNPVLVGEPGVGKTAIVEGLAQRIVVGTLPPNMRRSRLVTLDLGRMLAGSKVRGEFEKRMADIVTEITTSRRPIILFVDEIHTLVGAGGGEGSMDASNLLKPDLARGDIQMIGATTMSEYRRHIERDAALERRFQPVAIGEPTVQDAVSMLEGLRSRYEQHHLVRIGDDAIRAAVEFSHRYLTDRRLPDKAIDLMDQSAVRVRLRGGNAPEVTRRDVADVVEQATGIPVLLRAEQLLSLVDVEDELRTRVIGQSVAVATVADAVRRSRTVLSEPRRPSGSFLFLGAPGVGKTQLAKALAELLLGSEDALIRLDMSEFQERHSVNTLVGAPPGYVGHEESGRLTEAVRRRPYSVVLFDEIEKAHPDVLNTLLQVLDDGRLTDAHGRTVDFSETFVVMTSNVRADVDGSLDTALRRRFTPEFLDRIGDTVVFEDLDSAALRGIAERELARVAARLNTAGVDVAFDEPIADWIVRRLPAGADGARGVQRTVRTELERPFARSLVAGDLGRGSRVRVGVEGSELAIAATSPPSLFAGR